MYYWLRRCVIAVVVAVGLAASLSISLAQSPQSQPDEGPSVDESGIESFTVTPSSDVIQLIVKCLSNEKEAVLFTNSVDCAPYRKGHKHLKASHSDAPFDFNSDRDCPPGPPTKRPFNARHLTAESIRKLAKELDPKNAPHGIRIFRAIFCEQVDLVGLAGR